MAWDYTPSIKDAQEIRDGLRRLTVGSYHCIVNEVFEEQSKKTGNDMLVVEVKVLAGTMNDCADVVHSFYFTQNEWSFKDLLRLLIAAELCTQQEIDDAAQSNVPIRVGDKAADLKSKQLCFILRENSKNPSYPFATFLNVNSDEAEAIPKDLAAADMAKANADAEEVF